MQVSIRVIELSLDRKRVEFWICFEFVINISYYETKERKVHQKKCYANNNNNNNNCDIQNGNSSETITIKLLIDQFVWLRNREKMIKIERRSGLGSIVLVIKLVELCLSVTYKQELDLAT